MSEIKHIHVPNYAELSVKKVYPKVKQNAHVRRHLPDYPSSIIPDRAYFYSVLSTLFPREVHALVVKARSNRSVGEISDKGQLVKITPEIHNDILQLLNLPSNLRMHNNISFSYPRKGCAFA